MTASVTCAYASRLLAAIAVVAGSLIWAGTAPAAPLSPDDREGAQILRAVEDGKRDCRDLSATDARRVGEYAVGRMLGPDQAHESMDDLMASMMGDADANRMHEFMGRRFAGCGPAQMPPGFAGMMGTMGMMGGPGAAGRSGMMGGPGAAYMTPGRQVAFGDDDDDDWAGLDTAMVVMMAALLALALTAVVWLRPRAAVGARETPLDALDRRYARGEIDGEEYRRRRDALGGPA